MKAPPATCEGRRADLPAAPPPSHYEGERLLSEYAEFHYGDEYFGVPNFPGALAKFSVHAMGSRSMHRVLDLGCALGRASFELARFFEEVSGVDYSAGFTDLATRIAREGMLHYSVCEEGELLVRRERRLADLGLEATRDRVVFFRGDACRLDSMHTGYDLILAANLIDRLYDPAGFLDSMHGRLHPGGLLVIATPGTWRSEYTPRESWLGGFERHGLRITTLDGLKSRLGERFRLAREPLDLPFVMRETKRKFQHALSEVTVWERIG